MKLFKVAAGVAAGLFAFGGVAEAAWHEASTTHFVIYADQDPARLREFAVKLEKFDRAVRIAQGLTDLPPGQGNRLTVFVVSNIGQIEKLTNRKNQNVAGFYLPRATGSLAFVPRSAGSGAKTDIDEEIIFFHEYAHHLMMQQLDHPSPEWLTEGFAEFMATAEFPKDGTVVLGTPAYHRARSLFSPFQMPVEKLLAGNYGTLESVERSSLYARGWALTHYLSFEPARRGQLSAYVRAIADGMEPLKAAQNAFGDLKKLDRDLDAYVGRRRLSALTVAANQLAVGTIEVKPLSAGAAALMPLRMQLKRGPSRERAAPLAGEIRLAAVPYPDDPTVQLTLAEAELAVGNAAAAEQAADRALKSDPKSTEAMIHKGRAVMARAEKSRAEADWKEARRWFMSANQLDTEDPEPLMLFFQSYLRQGLPPTPNAIEALHYASNLSPQDRGLRMNSGLQYLRDGKLAEARSTIAPVAYDPHGRAASAAARKVLELIAKGDRAGALAVKPPAAEAGASN